VVENSGAIMGDGWVGVYLDQPKTEVLVNHEVHSKQLEVVAFFLILLPSGLLDSLKQAFIAGFQHIQASFLHFNLQILPYSYTVSVFLLVLLVDEPREDEFSHLVALLELAIVCGVRLNGVIGEMDDAVGGVDVKWLAGSADVAFFVAIHAQLPVEESHQHIAPNIKLASAVQQRFDVTLQDDASALTPLGNTLPLLYLLRKSTFKLFYCLAAAVGNGDTSAAVGVFSRLDHPMLFAACSLLQCLHNRVAEVVEFKGFRN
jgi:hypothetical protein